MIQGVADTYDTYRTRPWEDKLRVNTLVVIGRWELFGKARLSKWQYRTFQANNLYCRHLDKVKLQEDFTKALTNQTSWTNRFWDWRTSISFAKVTMFLMRINCPSCANLSFWKMKFHILDCRHFVMVQFLHCCSIIYMLCVPMYNVGSSTDDNIPYKGCQYLGFR